MDRRTAMVSVLAGVTAAASSAVVARTVVGNTGIPVIDIKRIPDDVAKSGVYGCPFCGNEKAPRVCTEQEIEGSKASPDVYTVCCNMHEDGCGACSGWRFSIDEAKAGWNRWAES
jgi:hypothetical protein